MKLDQKLIQLQGQISIYDQIVFKYMFYLLLPHYPGGDEEIQNKI